MTRLFSNRLYLAGILCFIFYLMPTPNNPTNPSDLMIEVAKRQLAAEMPEEAKAASIHPMGLLGKMLYGHNSGVLAMTTPWNSIEYDRDKIKDLPQSDINDILAHELTHVRQNNEMSVWDRLKTFLMPSPDIAYSQRPEELEAFQTSKNRALKEGRTMLPQPGFLGGPTRYDDINLDSTKPALYTVKP